MTKISQSPAAYINEVKPQTQTSEATTKPPVGGVGFVSEQTGKELFEQLKDKISIDGGPKCKCHHGHGLFFNTGPQAVDNALNSIMKGSEAEDIRAMNGFRAEVKTLNDSELDETRDYIVKKMSGEKNPEARAVLHEMYNVVDGMLDNPKPFKFPKFPGIPMPKLPKGGPGEPFPDFPKGGPGFPNDFPWEPVPQFPGGQGYPDFIKKAVI